MAARATQRCGATFCTPHCCVPIDNFGVGLRGASGDAAHRATAPHVAFVDGRHGHAHQPYAEFGGRAAGHNPSARVRRQLITARAGGRGLPHPAMRRWSIAPPEQRRSTAPSRPASAAAGRRRLGRHPRPRADVVCVTADSYATGRARRATYDDLGRTRRADRCTGGSPAVARRSKPSMAVCQDHAPSPTRWCLQMSQGRGVRRACKTGRVVRMCRAVTA